MSLKPFPIVGLTKGLQTNVKPAMLPDQAWALLENAYTWRERELKREGRQLLGRLRRTFTDQSLGNTGSSGTSFTIANIFSTLGFTEPQAELEAGSLVISVASPTLSTFTDNGNGTFTVTGDGVAAGSYVNYITGEVVLKFTAIGGASAVTANVNYFPTLPSMGINTIDGVSIIQQGTIFFDTKYAYVYSTGGFVEYIPGTTWTGTDYNFFWSCNFRGADASSRLFFVTNDNITGATFDPMRYTNGITWTNFTPVIADNPPSAQQSVLYNALILIPYYGRLLALNTWEGTTSGTYTGAENFYNRCRFSQLGDPSDQVNGWRSDKFGRGGFLDAPTDQAITGCTFIKNTLVVDFTNTTWQLRYVGEYGLPFIWERISADFGSSSTFSGVLFDNNRLVVGDKAITASHSNSVDRIDLDIPDQVFNIANVNQGPNRVYGIRDYQRELVYWNYPDSSTEASPGVSITFPNKVLLYNYRNKSWAIFRDSITTFGKFQSPSNITWGDTSVFWNSEDVLWSNTSTQQDFPLIVCGDQQGFISVYGDESPSQISTVQANDQETLTVQGVNLSGSPIVITSVNHNLQPGDIIYLSNMNFLDNSAFTTVTTSLNNSIYQVANDNNLTINQFSIYQYNFSTKEYDSNFPYTPYPVTYSYVGGGRITLFPRLNILTKDINIFQGQSMQTKVSYLDFLFEPVPTQVIQNDNLGNLTTPWSTFSGTLTSIVPGSLKINVGAVSFADSASNGILYGNPGSNSGTINYKNGNFTINFSPALATDTPVIVNYSVLSGAVAIYLYLNASSSGSAPGVIGYAQETGNTEMSLNPVPGFYTPGSQYSWFKFYKTISAQYFSVNITYDDALMNTFSTHSSPCTLYGINAWCRAGGRSNFGG